MSSSCFAVAVVCLNLFKIQLRPRVHAEAHPTLWPANAILPSLPTSDSEQEDTVT